MSGVTAWGNTDGSKDARSGENNYSFASEYGNNISDVRQSFNLNMLYQLPYGSDAKSGSGRNSLPRSFSGDGSSGRCSMPGPVCPSMWKLPGIRPIVYRNNTTGVITTSPLVASDGTVLTTPIVNVPGGGQSRNVQRPDLVLESTLTCTTKAGCISIRRLSRYRSPAPTAIWDGTPCGARVSASST